MYINKNEIKYNLSTTTTNRKNTFNNKFEQIYLKSTTN